MQKTAQAPVPFSLPQQRIVLALAELYKLRNDQICRRWYKPGCIASIWRNIPILEGRQLVTYEPRLLNRSADGRAQRLYKLTAAGWRAATALGAEATIRTRTLPAHRYQGQEHLQAVNDVFCALHEFERGAGGAVQIVATAHDLALKRDPLALIDGGKAVAVIPDGWLHVRYHGEDRRFWVEVDRGTELDEAIFRAKIRRILLAARGKAQEKWGGKGFRVLVIVDPEKMRRLTRRFDEVLAWTERELRERRSEGMRELFLFGAVDPAAVSGTALFTAPWFLTPFDRTPRPILPPLTGV